MSEHILGTSISRGDYRTVKNTAEFAPQHVEAFRIQADGSGVASYTFDTPFNNNPIISVSREDSSPLTFVTIVSSSTTGCVCNAYTIEVQVLGGVPYLSFPAAPGTWMHITAMEAT
jgi:hypothetical protein